MPPCQRPWFPDRKGWRAHSESGIGYCLKYRSSQGRVPERGERRIGAVSGAMRTQFVEVKRELSMRARLSI